MKEARWQWFGLGISGLATLAMTYIMQQFSTALKTPIAPASVLDFEFAGSVERADAILRAWTPAQQQAMGFSLGLDYAYILLYAPTLMLGVSLAIKFYIGRSAFGMVLGKLLFWLMLGAGCLDMYENYALWQLLKGSQAPIFPTIAFVCAAFKFTIILTGLGYLLVSGGFAFMQWLQTRKRSAL